MRKRFGCGGIVGAVLFLAPLVRPFLASIGQARLVDQFVSPKIAPYVTNANLLYVGVIGLVLILIALRRTSSGGVALSAAKSPDPKVSGATSVAVIAHNLTDSPSEKVSAVISFPGTQIRAHIRCDSPVEKGRPVTADVYFSMNTEHQTPVDGLTTILAIARREEQTRLGHDWKRIRSIGPASEADRSVIFDVTYQDANGRPGGRKHVLKYTLFNDEQVSISPL